MKHNYPISRAPSVANVDIEHVMESMKPGQVDVGSWLNVIGYVQDKKEHGIFVQAITIWSAGNVELDTYVRAIEKRSEAG